MFDKDLNNLPNSIEYIELPKKYSKKIMKIPTSLKKILCFEGYTYIDDLKNICIESYYPKKIKYIF